MQLKQWKGRWWWRRKMRRGGTFAAGVSWPYRRPRLLENVIKLYIWVPFLQQNLTDQDFLAQLIQKLCVYQNGHYEPTSSDRLARKKGTQIYNLMMFSSNRGLLYGQETPAAKLAPLLIFLLHHHFLFHCFSCILFTLLFFYLLLPL